MKKIFLIILILTAGFYFGQTHIRKTRSDKGKTHNHTTKYYVKKALKPKSTTRK